MKQLINLQQNELTMSSRDLLDVINEVRKSENENPIRANDFHARVTDELSEFNYETFVVQNLNKTESIVFKLTQDMCMLVAMRESKKVRRAVLEQLKNKFKQDQFKVPQTYQEALRIAADIADENEKLRNTVQEMIPDVKALDRIAGINDSVPMTTAAKTLQVRPSDLTKMMSENKWIYHRVGGRTWLGYQDKIQSGYIEHKITEVYREDGSLKVCEQVRVTPKGIAKLAKMIDSVNYQHQYKELRA